MSHQTGISADDALLRFFGSCREGNIRAIQIFIKEGIEQLVLGGHALASSSWKKDYDKCVLPFLIEKQPMYILYRLDTKQNNSYEWILISWSPDDSPVRQKMLYASTKATLKKEFGGAQIVDELFGTCKEEVVLDGYLKQKQSDATPAPLTSREEEIQELQKLEVGVDYGIDTRHQTLAGVAFPLTRRALHGLQEFVKAKLQYVQLKIDTEKEEIDITDTQARLPVNDLCSKVPTEAARYHLYRFDHVYEGDAFHSVVFVYSMPGYSCPIKERMLYSSSKNPLTEYLENVLNLALARKMEISEGEELAESNLIDELHPKKNLHRPKFAKPKGPANRGAKRLTKPVD